LTEVIDELIALVSSDFAIGIIVGIVVVVIGLAFYGARRMEDN